MATLSKEKLDYYKSKKHLTNLQIASLTGIPISNIDKIFSGFNQNPTFITLQKISNILECTLDDLINYDDNEYLQNYYEEKQVAKLAQEILSNKQLKELHNISKELSQNDISLMLNIAKRFQK